MRVTVSPDKMSVLASNASAALHLIARGISDPSVTSGLRQATNFCAVLSEGDRIRSARSNHFSAVVLARKDFLNLVCELPDGDRLTAEFPKVKKSIEELQGRFSKGGDVPENVRSEALLLAKYFFDFANKLALYEAARSRLTTGRNARA